MKTKWSLYLVSLHVAAVFSAIMALAAPRHIGLERNRQ